MLDHRPNPIDDLFARKLEGASVKAPAHVWEGVSAAMENQRLRKRVFIAQATAAASIVLLVGVSIWFMLGNRQESGIVNVAITQGAQAGKAQEAQDAISAQYEVPCPDASVLAEGVAPAANTTAQRPANLGKQTRRIPTPLKTRGQSEPLYQEVQPWMHPLKQQNEYRPAPAALLRELQPELPGSNTLALNPAVLPAESHQGPEDRAPRNHRFAVGATAAPDFAMASRTPVALAKSNVSSKNVLPEDPKNSFSKLTPVVAVTSGLNMGYALNDRFSVNTGCYYTERKSETDHAILTNGEAETVSTTFSVSYLEIPATIKYDYLKKKHWSSYVSSGVSTNLFLQYDNAFASNTGVNARRVSEKSDALSVAQTSFVASAGVDIGLTDRINLNLEPRLRYGFYTNNLAFSQSNPLSVAGFSGINYKF